MVAVQQSIHDRMVREAADRYIRQGYSVQINPSDEELPDFLRGYHPDLIITTPESRIVAEVKTKERARQYEYWQGLKNAIDAQPGWRLQLILDNRREEELSSAEQSILSASEIKARLLAGQTLNNNGLPDSALIVVWSALEAALRAASRAEGLQLPNQGSGPLITALYTDGQLEREDYDALMRILQVRNQAAHGFRSENLDRSLIDEAQKITRRLMKHHYHIK